MKKNIAFLTCILLIIGTQIHSASAQQAEIRKQKKQKSTIKLFNGENLDGWYTFIKNRGRNNDPKGVYSVKDGMIRISGEEWGSLTTNKEYKNYRLVTEFRWGDKTFEPRIDKTRDSGILVHSQGSDGAKGGTWMYSIECQIIEGGTGDIIIVGDESKNFRVTSTVADEKQGGSFVYHPEGRSETIHSGRINWYGRDTNWKDVIGFRGKNDVEKPAGEWNTLECIADGDTFIINLNGILVNKATRVKPRNGRIQIQSEGAEIFFRKVELTPL